MQELKFYDLKTKKSFLSSKYKIVKKKVKNTERTFAVADTPSGIKAWRIIKG